jgi:hypothetical protein
MPEQPLGSVISLLGSLNTMRLMLHWPKGPGSVRPPSARIRLDVDTFVHAAKAASMAARDVVRPSFASPVESIR